MKAIDKRITILNIEKYVCMDIWAYIKINIFKRKCPQGQIYKFCVKNSFFHSELMVAIKVVNEYYTIKLPISTSYLAVFQELYLCRSSQLVLFYHVFIFH